MITQYTHRQSVAHSRVLALLCSARQTAHSTVSYTDASVYTYSTQQCMHMLLAMVLEGATIMQVPPINLVNNCACNFVRLA